MQAKLLTQVPLNTGTYCRTMFLFFLTAIVTTYQLKINTQNNLIRILCLLRLHNTRISYWIFFSFFLQKSYKRVKNTFFFSFFNQNDNSSFCSVRFRLVVLTALSSKVIATQSDTASYNSQVRISDELEDMLMFM